MRDHSKVDIRKFSIMENQKGLEDETRHSPDGDDVTEDAVGDVQRQTSKADDRSSSKKLRPFRKKSEGNSHDDIDGDNPSDSAASSRCGYDDDIDDDDDDDIIKRQDSNISNDVNDTNDRKLTLHDIIELSNDIVASDLKRHHDNEAFSDSDDDSLNNDAKKNTKTKAIVSFVIDDVEQEEKEKKKLLAKEGRRKRDLISALTSDLSLMYGGILSLVGFALPLTEALRNEWMTTTTVGAFNVYIYLVSSIFLVYVSVYMWISDKRKAKKEKDKEGQSNEETGNAAKEPGGVVMLRVVNPPSGRSTPAVKRPRLPGESANENETPFSTYEEETLPKTQVLPEPPRERKHRPSGNSIVSDNFSEEDFRNRRRRASESTIGGDRNGLPLIDEIYDEVMVLQTTASLGHEGASFYLRLGALLFGMANFVYVIVQIDERFRQANTGCYDLPEVYPMFFHLIFLIIQTFFIFKNTKIHLKSHKHFARFGFAHVLATNMCNWFRILVFEVMEGVYKTTKVLNKKEKGYNKTYVTPPNQTSCLHLEGIYYAMAPYLFPFVLEYSLVAVATMAGMYQSLNVRVTQDILQAVKKIVWQRRNKQEYGHNQEHEEIFSKSHKGLFGGVILLAGALVAIIMFHFALSFDKNELKALMVYYWTDIVLHAVLIPPVIYCAVTFSKFKFTFNRENTIDDFLLILSMGGLVLYNIFVAFTSVSGELFYEEYDSFDSASSRKATYLNLAGAVLNIVQAIGQGVFVIAGLQLCACSREQSEKKPGRGSIAFLIMGNIALWFFKTFIIKEVSLHRFVDFYGPTAWPIIMNTNLPLVLFYRFHVSVCLADMWALVYKPEIGPKYKTL